MCVVVVVGEVVGSANATGNYGGQTSQTATNLTKVRIGGVAIRSRSRSQSRSQSQRQLVAAKANRNGDAEAAAEAAAETEAENRKQTATKLPLTLVRDLQMGLAQGQKQAVRERRA